MSAQGSPIVYLGTPEAFGLHYGHSIPDIHIYMLLEWVRLIYGNIVGDAWIHSHDLDGDTDHDRNDDTDADTDDDTKGDTEDGHR